MKNFIMALTYSRIISGPFIFIFSVFFNLYFLSFILFLVSAITDYFDGFLARKFSHETNVGKLLDPIADKMIFCSSIFAIVLITQDYFIGFMGMIMLLREFWVSGLREFTALNNISSASDVTFLAKLKTALQFLSISLFFFSFSYDLSLGIFISSFTLFLSLLVSLKTALNYSDNSFK